MTYLLDTHTFLWCAFDQRKLSRRARAAIVAAENDVVVSVVSFWEISLKYGLGRLQLTGTTPDRFPDIAARMGFGVLSLDAADAASFHQLPRDSHRDPFDRMLAWQAIARSLTLVTKDAELTAYTSCGLKVLW